MFPFEMFWTIWKKSGSSLASFSFLLFSNSCIVASYLWDWEGLFFCINFNLSMKLSFLGLAIIFFFFWGAINYGLSNVIIIINITNITTCLPSPCVFEWGHFFPIREQKKLKKQEFFFRRQRNKLSIIYCN